MRLRLLDPRFKYIPAAATDVAATWRRFGFDPRGNESRRAGTNFNRVTELVSKSERKVLAAK